MFHREGSWKLIGVRPSSGRRIIASETSVNFYETTRRNIPEGYCRGNLKSQL
jgi:hypothetical protein